MKKLLFAGLSAILLTVVGMLIYFYPIQMQMAEKAVNNYLKEQGIPIENIKNREVKMDYTQGGYITYIEYKDDPGLEYRYHWLKARGVFLMVYKNYGSLESGMKYPPLE